MWCGTSNEVILVLTESGTVYRSRDRGGSWKRLQQVMSQVGGQVADQDQEVSEIPERVCAYSCVFVLLCGCGGIVKKYTI